MADPHRPGENSSVDTVIRGRDVRGKIGMVQDFILQNFKNHEIVIAMPKKCPCCDGSGYLETGDEMRKLRKKMDPDKNTLEKVAGRMKISTSQLSNLENDRWDWTAELAVKYRRALK
jgi:cysteine synthase